MPTHYAGTVDERRALNVFIKLMRAAESVGARAGAGLAEAGLTGGQFGVLETLYHLGPLSISEIARKHLMSRNNFTVVVGNLERRGLVAREPDERDRRAVRVTLTDAGRALVGETLPGRVSSIMEQMRVLTPEEQEQLGTLLRRLGKQEFEAGL
jgi:MarR family 2-MHQ and catechol resistance regulon transcriptional repressor